MSIYNTIPTDKKQTNFKPTWLYIKQHNVTGLKYFGKTVQKDPYKYKGSGSAWSNHLREHGNDVTTVWCQMFYSQEELSLYAAEFSKQNNIVESAEWANVIVENGKSGGGVIGANKGRKLSYEQTAHLRKPKSEEHKRKLAEAGRQRKHSEATKEKMRATRQSRKCSGPIRHTDEAKRKISINNGNRKLKL